MKAGKGVLHFMPKKNEGTIFGTVFTERNPLMDSERTPCGLAAGSTSKCNKKEVIMKKRFIPIVLSKVSVFMRVNSGEQ